MGSTNFRLTREYTAPRNRTDQIFTFRISSRGKNYYETFLKSPSRRVVVIFPYTYVIPSLVRRGDMARDECGTCDARAPVTIRRVKLDSLECWVPFVVPRVYGADFIFSRHSRAWRDRGVLHLGPVMFYKCFR